MKKQDDGKDFSKNYTEYNFMHPVRVDGTVRFK